jgi:uncharacterized protein (DUF305 family)
MLPALGAFRGSAVRFSTFLVSSLLVVTLLCAGCSRANTSAAVSPAPVPGSVVQPGAPGQPSKELPADTKSSMPIGTFIPADAQFMQGMIHHHAQALQMTALLYTHTDNPVMQSFARKIDNSQGAEIKWMDTWLQDRNQTVPMIHDGMVMMTGMDMPMMPGMLTDAQMKALGEVRGRDFDRLFLNDMIQHHTGALSMVRDLEATPGAAGSPEVYTYITNVDVDQRTDIDRMHEILRTMQ